MVAIADSSPSPSASSLSSLSDPSSSVPGYLPDYQGDRYTDPRRIAETKALNAPFFQSIGGAPSPPPLTPSMQGVGSSSQSGDTQYYNPSTQYTSTGYGTQQQYDTNGYANPSYNTQYYNPSSSSAQYNPSTGYYQPLSTNTGYVNGQSTNNCCQTQYGQTNTYNNGYYDSSSTNCCYQGSTSSCCSSMLNTIGYSQPSTSQQYYNPSSSSTYNQQYGYQSTPSTNTAYYQPYGRK